MSDEQHRGWILGKYWNQLSFRFPILIVLFSILVGLTVGAIALYVANRGLIDSYKDNMVVLRNERSRAITTEIEVKKRLLDTFAHAPVGLNGVKEFGNAFRALDASGRATLIKAYTEDNRFPKEDRMSLSDAGDNSAYTAVHKAAHRPITYIVQLNNLYDILLVDLNGDVVYSAKKEGDFGANLLHGPLKDELSGELYRKALANSSPPEVVMADLRRYPPSDNKPTFMMARALQDASGEVTGVAIFQIDIGTEVLSAAANNTLNLGETGEVQLIGEDLFLRSDSRFAKGMALEKKIDTYSPKRAIAGFEGVETTVDFRAHEVVSAYAPLDIMGVRWAVIAKIDLAEVQAPVRKIAFLLLAGVIASIVVIGSIGYAVTRSVSRPLKGAIAVMDQLTAGNHNVDVAFEENVQEIRAIGHGLRAFKDGLIKTNALMAEVQKNQERLVNLLDSSPTGILVLSSDNEVLFVNDPGASILDRQKGAFIGETFSFADIAVNAFEANRMIIAARRDGFVKEAQLVIRVSEKGEVILNLSVRRTTYKDKEAYLIWFSDITETLRANKELNELSTRFVALLENTPDLITIKDRNLRYQVASQSIANTFGVRSWRDLIGKTQTEVWPGGADKAPKERATEEIFAGKSNGSSEEREALLTPGHWIATTRAPIRDERGAVSAVIAITRDITDSKRLQSEVENALADAKVERERTDAILAGAPDPIVIVRPDSKIEYVNKQLTNVLGYEASELIGQSIEMLIPQRFRPNHKSQVKGFFETSQVRFMGAGRELFALAKSGQEIPVAIALSPVKAGDRSVVVAAIRDITEQEKAAAQIRYSNMMSESALDLTTAGYWRIDYADPDYYISSERTASIFGEFPKADWRYHLNDEWMNRIAAVDPEAADATAKKYSAALDGKTPFYDTIYPYKRPLDGKVIWTRAIGKIERDGHGKPRFMYGVNQDITHIKEAESELEKAKQAAEAATKSKSDFLASMSHEIRTPMNGITGMAEVLAQTALDDEQKHMLRTIRESGNALITVINDILDFSKIEAGKLDLESVSMSIVDAVEGAAATLTPNAVKKGVHIHVFVDPQIPTAVHSDPTRLRQILFNLGGNAVKFSNGKDIQIRAVLSAKSDDARTWVRFSVIDKGIGISKENQAKLFQAFSQAETSTTRKYGGTGLGLAICKRLTEMMGGTIGVESLEGRGSTFWVELPFQEIEGAKSSLKERDLHGLQVLLVGSDGPRGEAIETYLRHWGADVSAAKDTDAAVIAVARRGNDAFDSIVLDLDLDGERQKKALTTLRKTVAKNRMILLQDYQHRGARIVDKDVVALDANPLVRYRIVSAVAVAAGRASPEIKTEEDAVKFVSIKAPTVDDALAKGQLILLAEDNLTNQDVIRRQLNLIGYTCETVLNGVEALSAYQTGRYALLLTDCHMPEMDGYELTGKIRGLESGSDHHLPIIAVTANALQGEAERCIAAGMDDYVSKPIAMPAIVAALKKWMPPPHGQAPEPTRGGKAEPLSKASKPQATDAKETSTSRDIAIDERAIKDTFGDDEETFKEILQSFVEPSQDIIVDIIKACEGRDAPGVKDAAHKLKSSARTVGAHSLADTCTALESAGKAADWITIEKLAPTAREQFKNVEIYISKL